MFSQPHNKNYNRIFYHLLFYMHGCDLCYIFRLPIKYFNYNIHNGGEGGKEEEENKGEKKPTYELYKTYREEMVVKRPTSLVNSTWLMS